MHLTYKFYTNVLEVINDLAIIKYNNLKNNIIQNTEIDGVMNAYHHAIDTIGSIRGLTLPETEKAIEYTLCIANNLKQQVDLLNTIKTQSTHVLLPDKISLSNIEESNFAGQIQNLFDKSIRALSKDSIFKTYSMYDIAHDNCPNLDKSNLYAIINELEGARKIIAPLLNEAYDTYHEFDNLSSLYIAHSLDYADCVI